MVGFDECFKEGESKDAFANLQNASMWWSLCGCAAMAMGGPSKRFGFLIFVTTFK